MRAEPVAEAAGADPLFLLPYRYEDRTRITPIGALAPGTRAVVEGEVQLADVVFRRRRSLLVKLSDGSGFLTLRFFHFSRAQQQGFARGTRMVSSKPHPEIVGSSSGAGTYSSLNP